MIDWLTLRVPLNGSFSGEVHARLQSYLGRLVNVASSGEITWEKATLDIDALRSDTPGLCWQVVGDGKETFLAIGASPASLEHGCNVFGSDDIGYCAEILKRHAEKALACILPPLHVWQCRRLDVTFNYRLGGLSQVQQALRELRKGDGVRQKASVPRGDTVVWGQGSDLISGKAYAKGPQLRFLSRKRGHLEIPGEWFDLADNLLRLELSLKSRWFRRHGAAWLGFSSEFLSKMHSDYFGKYIGQMEVTDMGQMLEQLEKVAPSKGQALAAHRTWALIKTIGYETAKGSMPRRTFARHLHFLRLAGVSDSDLTSATIVPFRRNVITLGQPVTSWEELRKAA